MTDPTRAHLDTELAALNEAVTAALRARKEWMDAHMPAYAKYQVGEEIFDMRTGARLGVISKLYRYHADRDARYDTSMSVEYQYCTHGNCYDNTSRQPGLWFGNAAELAAKLKSDAEYAAWRVANAGGGV